MSTSFLVSPHSHALSESGIVKRETSDVSKADSSPHSSHSTSRSIISASVNTSSPFLRNNSIGLVSPFSGGSSPDSNDSTPSPPLSHQSLDTASPPPPPTMTHSISTASTATGSPPMSSPPPLPPPASYAASTSPDDSDSGISGFIRKTFHMVSDTSTSDIVSWDDAGDSFIVKKEFEFASLVLPRYFRHKNFSSFVRQLNFYGFHKRSHQSKYTKFQHPYFKRGQLHNLHLIKRKSAEANANFKDNIAQLTAQVTDLKRQYDDLYRIQQQILYIFARYMKAYPLPPQMDGNMLPSAAVPSPSTGEDRGGKRQRLLGDGTSHPAYSTVDNLSAPSLNGIGAGNALMQVPLSSSTSTLAALLSSPSPASLPPMQPPTGLASLSARDAEIQELNALQAVLSQLPTLGQQQGLQIDPSTAAALAVALQNYNSRSNITAMQAAAAAAPPAPPINEANSALAALAAPGGPLSHLSPLMLSALSALGNAGGASASIPQQQQPSLYQQQQQQVPAAPSVNPLASVSQLSGLSSLSALPPLSSLSTSAPPLSAQDLLQLLQHAHPDNRASRLSAIRQEQRMLEDEDDDMEDEDDQQYDNEVHYGGAQHSATAGDWLASTAASMMSGLPATSGLSESSFNRIASPRRSNAAAVESKLPTSTSFLPGTVGGMFDSYSMQQAAAAVAKATGLSSGAPFKTQEIGSLYSSADDPYMSSLHSQLAAASSSQNAASSVSMSSSIVSPATPLHLKPSSSITHDGGVVLTPQLHATLSQLLSGTHPLASSVDSHTQHYGNAAMPNLHVGDGFTQSALMDGQQLDGHPNLSLVNQLQAIANVSRHLQNMYHPNMTTGVHPSTTSAFDPSRIGQHQQQQQQQQSAAGFPPLTGFTGPQSSSGHASHLLFDDKYGKGSCGAGQSFYQQLQNQPPPMQQHQQHHQSALPPFTTNSPALSAFAPSPTPQPYSHPFVSDSVSGGSETYHHPSSAIRHNSAMQQRSSGGGAVSVGSHGSVGRSGAAPPL